ncbi:MAG: hypothetical protein A2W97_01520 [Bacteroidetes bacterium GWE2_40_63]|nr:MAG: hypothetical protein A2W95_18135 [Bacteroidetes bacterium GWA2_40_14]OFX57198.1 MAG: hypothetical protein A2W84_15265 [Bacteroidetes bacterium GWC2_40_13]OFX72300.1 MAG: hypothetical protein A2W96_17880 [Bacteroidetes bacterium GWD2_40_43]OFX90452.1 MAG: hypothetical protein A2W97_01520 [Bacteroidetes bacterium GWE2_40_63]OFY17302.1 MAG: hypothetical protein A2W88_15345 [Bacteroidetes bacterium GWF2_40_13]OFZ27354.1 MAG: hypothetical protein A2437_13915 [Bacteroidetes bacterium RIFOXYC
MFQHWADWLKDHSRPCFYKKHLGFECPGCGFQRAVIELLQGNLLESIRQYPALLPIIALFTVLALHLFFRFKFGAALLKGLFILVVLLIIGNFIFKFFQNY